MNLPFKTKFFLIVGLQLMLLVGLIGSKQVTLLTGQRVLLKTVPVDPRDLFRGDYVVLSYDISRIGREKWRDPSYQQGDTVYVTLRPEGKFWETEQVSRTAPGGKTLFVRGTVTYVADDSLRLEYGIESYFVPEGTGHELERAAGHGLAVEASVDRAGRAAIRRVAVEGDH
jgi:uncharacterized membrane-anchored protein